MAKLFRVLVGIDDGSPTVRVVMPVVWLLLALAVVVAAVEVVSAPVEWLWPYRLGGNTHWKGTTTGNCVSLTFDDGPSRYTHQVLEILSEQDTAATFFVMGRQVERFPDLVAAMASEGHEIGNHTYSLVGRKGLDLGKLYAPFGEDEIERTQEVVRNITGASPRYFRSPGGQLGRGLWRAVIAHDLEVVNGTLPFPDPEVDAQTQLDTVAGSLRPGAIIILHDGDDGAPDSDRPRAMAEMLPELIRIIKDRGLQIAHINSVLRSKECKDD